ncbi:hypothetical protein [Gorillibacterium timonense]|uniref:hypothetical protein n=1 Tax=Gorillibacterium timonense TaxID=1689269 RepID=UPI00071D5C48|nr:hypothetical protein [Gorillibacterium timonense]
MATPKDKLDPQEMSFKQYLDSRPKVKIEIPEDPNNPGDVVPVAINGVIYAIPVGQEFEVPDLIYNVWKESHEKTKAANKKIKITELKELQIIG